MHLDGLAMLIKIVASLSATLLIVLWSGTIWGDWGIRTYDRLGPDSGAWFWLRLFHVPVNRSNCVRLMKGVSWVGIALVAMGTAVMWITI